MEDGAIRGWGGHWTRTSRSLQKSVYLTLWGPWRDILLPAQPRPGGLDSTSERLPRAPRPHKQPCASGWPPAQAPRARAQAVPRIHTRPAWLSVPGQLAADAKPSQQSKRASREQLSPPCTHSLGRISGMWAAAVPSQHGWSWASWREVPVHVLSTLKPPPFLSLQKSTWTDSTPALTATRR